MRRTLGVVILAASLLAACGSTSTPTSSEGQPTAQTPPASPGETSGPDPGADAASDFTVTTFQGDRFALADQRGMPVVINFFDSW